MKLLSKISRLINKFHSKYFIRKRFYKYHLFLYNLSLNGMGIGNCGEKLEGEEYFIKKYLLMNKGKKIIFDVGANIGSYSMKIRKYSQDASIYAFEPHPKNFGKLIEISKKNNIYAFNYACGDTNSRSKLFDFIENNGSTGASLYKEAIEKLFCSKTVEYDIDIKKIDDFASENSIDRIDLLKIDTEGHELGVLRGAANLINNHSINYIQFEFNNIHAISRVFFKDIFDLLYDFNLYRMLPDGLVSLNEYNPIYQEIFAFQNIVAIRKDIDLFKY